MVRLLVSLGLAFLLYGRTIGYPLIRPIEATGGWLGPTPLVEASFAIDAVIGGGADWAFRLTQILLLGLLGWVASGAVPRGTRRALILLLVVAHPMLLGSVMDPSARGELLLALVGTLALTRSGLRAGLYSLLAMAVHPLGTLLPVLGLWMPRAPKGKGRQIPWRLVAVALWWAWRLVMGGAALLGDVQNMGAGLKDAGAHAAMYARQLLFPLDPIYARTLPSFTDLEAGVGWTLWALALGGGLFFARRLKTQGVGLGAGLVLMALPLLLGSGIGPGAGGYGEARLAWPVVGMAWALSAALPLRMAAFALVPLLLGVTGIRAGDHKGPAQVWERVHETLPDDPMVQLALAHALAEVDPDRAIGLLETALVDLDDPDEKLRVRRALVQAYMLLDLKHEVRRHLAVLADPAVDGTASEMRQRCLLAAELGDEVWEVESAPITEVCAAVVAQAPEDLKLLKAAGLVAVGAGAPLEGREYLIRAVELAPEETQLRLLLSNLPLGKVEWHTSGPASPEPAQ